MENVKKPKVGAGIKTMAILQLIGSVFGLWSIKNFFVNNDKTNAFNKAAGMAEITNITITIGLIFAIILAVSVILILMKKELGIYIYFTTTVAQTAYSLVANKVSTLLLISLLVGLIMPVLMGIFIWKKREIFSPEAKSEQIDI